VDRPVVVAAATWHWHGRFDRGGAAVVARDANLLLSEGERTYLKFNVDEITYNVSNALADNTPKRARPELLTTISVLSRPHTKLAPSNRDTT
jgi:hypothetical protein